MKPEISLPQPSPEHVDPRRDVNNRIESNLYGPELGPDLKNEHVGNKVDTDAIVNDVSFTPILPTPVSATVIVDDDTTIDANPLIANDDDLIEKEWVDRAKKIVAGTKDNPYKREEEVSKLQIDYIKKRYGRELDAAA